MKLIGLSGPAGVGKDTIADYLVLEHGFTKFSFADPLYEEVARAFGVEVSFLQDRANKEKEQQALQYWYCKDKTFQDVLFASLQKQGVKYPMDMWLSPRQVLQTWGTEYRRMQDPEYWIKQADAFVRVFLERHKQRPHSEEYVGGLVQTSVRFPNERAFIEAWSGEVWHVRRPDWSKTVAGAQASHVAEQGLPVTLRDKVVHNSGTIEQLHTATVLLLGSEPGAVIHCDTHPAVEFVSCNGCGHVYRALTEKEAQEEIDDLKGVIASLPEDTQARYNTLSDITLDSYRSCEVCYTTAFKPIAPAEYPRRYRADVAGVIYDPQ